MRKIIYDSSEPYAAFIGRGALCELGRAAKGSFGHELTAVITDEGVPGEHVESVCSELRKAGFRPERFMLPAGEINKNLSAVESIYAFFYSLGINRACGAVAVGGGTVGDTAGFAAATYLRGLPFINIPTTLIAQTDSAYGGKTGVDYLNGKNYIGCFRDPAAVICDVDLLDTLDETQRLCGMGEVIKYGAIADPALLRAVALRKTALPDEDIIAACVELKRAFVSGDEHDNGKRRALNFGHTIGHAIEASSGYAVPHGQAVAYGMLAAAHIGANLGVTSAGAEEELAAVMRSTGLDTDWQGKAKAALSLISLDKKSNGSEIEMILLKSIGECIRMRLSPERIAAFIE